MTVGDLREIIGDPEIPDDLPLRLAGSDGRALAVALVGAHGELAGAGRYLALEVEPRP